MSKKIKLSHNLDDNELEEVLEKALKGLRGDLENPKDFSEKLANDLAKDNEKTYNKVIDNMLKEIFEVIDASEKG